MTRPAQLSYLSKRVRELEDKVIQLKAELRYYKAYCHYLDEGMTGFRDVYISVETATEYEEAKKALGGELWN